MTRPRDKKVRLNRQNVLSKPPSGMSSRTQQQTLSDRARVFNEKLRSGYKPTVEDFWFLLGVSVPERVERMRASAKGMLGWLRDPARKGSTEHHAEINRAIVEALRSLQVLSSAPPDELIELIAHQLQVSGRPRNTRRDDSKWRKAVTLAAANPDLSHRAVAKGSGAAPKTIRMWRKNPDFLQAVRSEKEWMDIKALHRTPAPGAS